MDDADALQREWVRAAAKAYAMAELAEKDPEAAGELTLSVQTDRDEPRSVQLLRAYAEIHIPKKFEWEITRTMGGHAWLTLQRIGEDEPARD